MIAGMRLYGTCALVFHVAMSTPRRLTSRLKTIPLNCRSIGFQSRLLIATQFITPLSRSNARSSPHNSNAATVTPAAAPPTAISTSNFGSSHGTSPSKQPNHIEDIPSVPVRTADSYIIIDEEPAAGHDKSGRDKPAQPSEKAKGTLRVIQKLQNTKVDFNATSSLPQQFLFAFSVPKPAPPHTNSPMAFPHRIPKPAGPRQKPANSRKPAQVGRGQIGVIPMN
ncbi:hypothetical protein BSL78_15539 [Apostichopus japonicus]|uniref:Uncharacterized protein n=1 Tax=Stichopus japonicus TaxID=307972 RepID=A0A2G8KHZ2_STIJA|nr:hypothetical protein BSL78_15539 [Apostichopus japonicus]